MDLYFYLRDVTTLNYYFIIGGIFLCYLIYRIFHSFVGDTDFIQTKYYGRGHTWKSIQCNKSIPYNIHCLECEKLMLPIVGLFCDSCGVSACKPCHKQINRNKKCKTTVWSSQHPFTHHWTPIGYLHDQEEEKEKKYFCCWCQRTKVSIQDISQTNQMCDFGEYKNIIIPPSCVDISRGSVKNIRPPPDKDWEPLIILANKKSGSNRSDEVLSLFRGLLNPIQVVDISRQSPQKVASWLPPRCRVLAAGGDGTVAWVLNALAEFPDLCAPVAILPMGTGNDLSRVLGWGPTCSSHLDARQIITNITQAVVQRMDRWKVTIIPSKVGGLVHRGPRVLYAYNYVSVGVDAQVALDFHRARAQFLYRFASRTLNYLTYLVMGAGRVLDGGCAGLENRIELSASNTVMKLPPLQSLVLLNISSWGAGVNLWELGEDAVEPQSICDGKLEIVGISSSFHIAQLQCGLAEPFRFTQTDDIYLKMFSSCPMQVDGEPWMQRPCVVTVSPAGQAAVLRAKPQGHAP